MKPVHLISVEDPNVSVVIKYVSRHSSVCLFQLLFTVLFTTVQDCYVPHKSKLALHGAATW